MKLPFQLVIEVTNRCNGNCIYCAIRDARPKPTDLGFEVYKQIVDAFPQAKEVAPESFGEPLLYPYIVDAVAYARERGKAVCIVTNGSLLTKEMSRALLEAKLNIIRFSVDASDAQTYGKLRPGLSWSKMVANIEDFHAIKREMGAKCSMLARVTLTDKNKGKAKQIKEFWRKRGCRVWLRPVVWTPPPGMKRKYSNGQGLTCKRANGTFVVKANGDVCLCCKDWWGWYVSGNVYKKNPAAIFGSVKHRNIRYAMREGKQYPAICDHCHVGKRI